MDTTRYFPHPKSFQEKAHKAGWTKERCIEVGRQLLDHCLRQYEPTPERSLGSLYIGALGPRVFLRLQLAKKLRDIGSEEATKEASKLLQDALQVAQDVDSHRSRSRITLLEGPYVGLTALTIVLLHSTGMVSQAIQQANGFITDLEQLCRNLSSSECEVLYGRAGALQAILYLRKELDDCQLGSDAALSIARSILMEGRRCALVNKHLGLPLLWEWHGSKYLGAAHGVVGILHTLLCLNSSEIELLEESEKPMLLIRETIQKLDQFCWPSGNLDSSIKESHRTDRLVHWCHGAPGYVLLLVKAAKVFHNSTFQARAQQIAKDVIWPRGLLRKGVGLCHGISGNAYALLAVAETDASFIGKASYFVDFALEHLNRLERVPDRPFSLFEGTGGLCSLILDLSEPKDARFPVYDY